MKYQKEKLAKNQLEIKVELEAVEFDQIFFEAIQELGKKINLPGFRPGQAPLDLVERNIGQARILEAAADKAIARTLSEIIQKEKIVFINQPKIDILKLAKGNPLVFIAIFTLLPKVKLGDYKKIKVERKEIVLPPDKIKTILEELQEIHREEKPVQRPAQKNDRIEVSLEIFLDGVPLEGGQIKNASFFLNKDYYLPGFCESLLGLRIGESKRFFLRYPETYFDRRLAGREAEFRVKVNNIYEVKLPAIDDDFARKVGPFDNLDQLKAEIEKDLRLEAERKEDERIEINILKNLVAISHFEEIPEVLIQEEEEKMFSELEHSLSQMKLNLAEYLSQIKKTKEDLEKEFRPKAEERIKTVLAIKAIAAEQGIEVTEQDIEEELIKQREMYKDKKEFLEYLDLPNYRDYLKHLLFNRKVIDWLKKQIVA